MKTDLPTRQPACRPAARWLAAALGLLILAVSGCGFRIVKTNPVIQVDRNRMVLADLDTSSFSIRYAEAPAPGDPNLQIAGIAWPLFEIEPNEPVRIPFRPLDYALSHYPIVDGRLNEHQAVAVEIDTGCSLPIIVSDHTIRRFRIPVFPLENKAGGLGVCDLPALFVGDLRLLNPPCFFLSQHLEFHVGQIPLVKEDTILLGLPALARFSYVRFDDPDASVTFSKDRPFVPPAAESWQAYPMAVREDPNYLGRRLEITLPLAGRDMKINFDSGGGSLVLKQSAFDRLRPRLRVLSESREDFLAYQHGPLKSRRVIVRDLPLAGRTLDRVQIDVLPDDTDYMFASEAGCLSLMEFKNTPIVLDFQSNRFWVQNHPQSP